MVLMLFFIHLATCYFNEILAILQHYQISKCSSENLSADNHYTCRTLIMWKNLILIIIIIIANNGAAIDLS